MSVTITQVKRAFEEVAKQQPGGPIVSPLDRQALIRLSGSTLVLTLIANSINQKLGADLVVKPVEPEIRMRDGVPKEPFKIEVDGRVWTRSTERAIKGLLTEVRQHIDREAEAFEWLSGKGWVKL